MGNQKFNPEYANAARFLAEAVQNPIKPTATISPDILYEGNMQKISRPFNAREIPCGDSWRWNQTKSRKDVSLGNARVQFFKLSPRRKGQSPKGNSLPQMKLWQFKVSAPGEEYYLLWCERGKQPSSLDIDDFSFLSSFMEDSALVSQLWPGK